MKQQTTPQDKQMAIDNQDNQTAKNATRKTNYKRQPIQPSNKQCRKTNKSKIKQITKDNQDNQALNNAARQINYKRQPRQPSTKQRHETIKQRRTTQNNQSPRTRKQQRQHRTLFARNFKSKALFRETINWQGHKA